MTDRTLHTSSETTGRFMLLAAAALWSLSGPLVKAIDLHPLTITLYRSVFTALCLVPFLPGRLRRPHPLSLLAVIAYTGSTVAYVAATKLTTAANAVLLLYTSPVYVFLLSALILKETPDRRSLISLAIAVIGMGVLFYGNADEANMEGILYGISSGAGFAVYMILIRRLRDFHPFYLTALHNAGVAIVLVLFTRPPPEIDASNLAVLAGMGVVQLAVPTILFTTGLQRVAAHEASMLILLEPALNITLVALFIGEYPSLSTLLGGALIVGALAFPYLPGVRKERNIARS